MITEKSTEELVELGAKLRVDYLIEQAGYTLGIAAADESALSELLPEEYLNEVSELRDELSAARSDKALTAEEAKDATHRQNVSAAEAKVWRRKAMRRASRAMRIGHPMPDGLLRLGRVRTVPALAGQLEEMTGLLQEYLTKMPGKNTQQLLDEGKALADALRTADATQELKRLKELPEKFRVFYERKGQLYIGLKVINDAGCELHADDPKAAGMYNLAILHRRGSKKRPPSSDL